MIKINIKKKIILIVSIFLLTCSILGIRYYKCIPVLNEFKISYYMAYGVANVDGYNVTKDGYIYRDGFNLHKLSLVERFKLADYVLNKIDVFSKQSNYSGQYNLGETFYRFQFIHNDKEKILQVNETANDKHQWVANLTQKLRKMYYEK